MNGDKRSQIRESQDLLDGLRNTEDLAFKPQSGVCGQHLDVLKRQARFYDVAVYLLNRDIARLQEELDVTVSGRNAKLYMVAQAAAIIVGQAVAMLLMFKFFK